MTVLQAPKSALSVAEGELYRCPVSPLLTVAVPTPDDVVLLAGDLRTALDACRALDDHLIDVATRVPGDPSVTPATH